MKEKLPRGEFFFLFLNLLEHFPLSCGRVELLQLYLPLHLLLVLACEDNVPGGALQLYQIYL